MKTAIVTGGTKGLGREISLGFARSGYFVVSLYSSDESAAQQLIDAIAKCQGRGLVMRHDVCSEDLEIWNHSAIQNAESLTLIHNACGAFTPAPMHQLAWNDFENALSVALKGAWNSSQPLLRAMLKKKVGTIVNVLTSAIEGVPPKGFAAYAVAKYALRGFTLALASEYSGRGIKTFSVSPGYMDTGLTSSWDSRLREIICARSRVTVPLEAARTILNLVEDATIPGCGEDYPV